MLEIMMMLPGVEVEIMCFATAWEAVNRPKTLMSKTYTLCQEKSGSTRNFGVPS
jgi:hypothetical protein